MDSLLLASRIPISVMRPPAVPDVKRGVGVDVLRGPRPLDQPPAHLGAAHVGVTVDVYRALLIVSVDVGVRSADLSIPSDASSSRSLRYVTRARP
jgi:hypothetical protein